MDFAWMSYTAMWNSLKAGGEIFLYIIMYIKLWKIRKTTINFKLN